MHRVLQLLTCLCLLDIITGPINRHKMQCQICMQVSIRFSGNRASVGPAVYISHLDHCSWFSVNTAENNTNEINVTFQIEQFPNWKVFEL